MNEHPTDEERVEDNDTVAEVAAEYIATPAEEESDSANEVVDEDIQESDNGEADPVGTRLILKRSGEETDIVFPFSTPASVGRFDPSVGPIDIDLGSIEEANYVSRKHAQILEEDGSYKLKDLGSSNGTFVLRDDFEKIDEAEIADGDEVAFGNARFVFRV